MKKKIVLMILAAGLVLPVFAQQGKDSLKNGGDEQGPEASGRIIHRDNKGCPTVIEAVREKEKDTLLLIPMGAQLGKLDKEGMHITFKFRTLRIKNPLGCDGIPARIWDVEKDHHWRRKQRRAKRLSGK